jgi:hypothetical protein
LGFSSVLGVSYFLLNVKGCETAARWFWVCGCVQSVQSVQSLAIKGFEPCKVSVQSVCRRAKWWWGPKWSQPKNKKPASAWAYWLIELGKQ